MGLGETEVVAGGTVCTHAACKSVQEVLVLSPARTLPATLRRAETPSDVSTNQAALQPAPPSLPAPQASQNPAGYLTGASEEELKIAKEKGLL